MWYWLVDLSIPRKEIGRQSMNFLFDWYKQKSSGKQNSNLNHQNRDLQHVNQFQDFSQFTDPGSLE